MTNATDYLIIVALSYPFFAFNSAVIGALRAVCDSKTALFISALMNILNVGGYAFFIFICDMNASGAAFSLLIVRIIGAALSAIFLLQGKSGLTIRGFFPFRFDGPIIKSICKVAIPVTAEIVLLMFDVMYHRIAKYLGPNALTAHSVGFSIITFLEIPASAICLTLMTVVGQLVGSGNLKEARYQINRMVIFSCFCLLTTAGIGYLCSDWFAALYHLSPQSSEYLTDILLIMMIALPLFWSGSFVTFNGLRAAGDGKFIIVVSIFTMCILRVGCGYLFAVYFGWGIRGLWSAMALDWLGRMIFFLWRKRGDKWYVNKLT
jgi:Na+-driven multidrug efflux pump